MESKLHIENIQGELYLTIPLTKLIETNSVINNLKDRIKSLEDKILSNEQLFEQLIEQQIEQLIGQLIEKKLNNITIKID